MHYPQMDRSGGTARTHGESADSPLALQARMRESIRAMVPDTRLLGTAGSWRIKDYLRGRFEACLPLEHLIDERITQGCTEEQALAVVADLELYIRARFAIREGACGTLAEAPLGLECEAEAAIEGTANVAQWAMVRTQHPVDMRRCARKLAAHRAAIGRVLAVVAAKLTVAGA